MWNKNSDKLFGNILNVTGRNISNYHTHHVGQTTEPNKYPKCQNTRYIEKIQV